MVLQQLLYSPQLHLNRTIRIYLPPSYASGRRYYSVVYMHDGQNLFSGGSAFGRPWRIEKIIDKMPVYKQAIVVGIDNGGGQRMDEYAPYRGRSKGGKGHAHLQFTVDTVKPWVDMHFRTLTTPDHTWIVGSSLGGLVTLYGGLVFPQVFGKVGVLSPSLWFNPQLLQQAPAGSLEASRFYVVGSRTESRGMESGLQRTYWRLKSLGVSDDRLKVIVRDRGGHNETFWSREFKKMYLEWMNTL
jgi:predicted alpha/beta superfamily hydrolase